MARHSSKRLDTSVTDAATVEKATRLMGMLDTGNADLYRGALQVFDWCVRQVQDGRHIMATDEAGKPAVELSTPLLDAARGASSRLVLDARAFDEVVRILDHPDQTTDALRDLMAGSR